MGRFNLLHWELTGCAVRCLDSNFFAMPPSSGVVIVNHLLLSSSSLVWMVHASCQLYVLADLFTSSCSTFREICPSRKVSHFPSILSRHCLISSWEQKCTSWQHLISCVYSAISIRLKFVSVWSKIIAWPTYSRTAFGATYAALLSPDPISRIVFFNRSKSHDDAALHLVESLNTKKYIDKALSLVNPMYFIEPLGNFTVKLPCFVWNQKPVFPYRLHLHSYQLLSPQKIHEKLWADGFWGSEWERTFLIDVRVFNPYAHLIGIHLYHPHVQHDQEKRRHFMVNVLWKWKKSRSVLVRVEWQRRLRNLLRSLLLKNGTSLSALLWDGWDVLLVPNLLLNVFVELDCLKHFF